jgi:cobaltochelatase CobT
MVRGSTQYDVGVAVHRALASPYRSVGATTGEDVHPPASRGDVGGRGVIDASAMRARFSDPRIYARFVPDGAMARALFDLLEQNRVEALGARAYAGVGVNLSALAGERWARASPEAVVRNDSRAWIETFSLLARVPLNAPLPAAAQQSVARSDGWMSAAESTELELLTRYIDDQAAFSVQALRVVDVALGTTRAEPCPPPPPKSRDSKPNTEAGGARTPSDGDPAQAPMNSLTNADRQPAAPADAPASAYRVFTDEFDVTALADSFLDSAALARRREELDRYIGQRSATINQWAQRLQRRLLSLRARHWEFDCEEGELDAGRLTRIATHPLESLVYKREIEGAFPATIVTLLIDNSGSMRGAPIATAASCAEILGRALEKCGVKTEILGFTTAAWRGGRSRRQWAAAGRAAHPGRLGETRHIIYKDANERWRRARRRMGAMLEDDLLKENVDGEALLWAHQRLRQHPEPRRILMVICDGAPLEEATLEVNDQGYLDRHLHEVIAMIERSATELVAIGIGHDVTRYYRRAVRLASLEELGGAIVNQLFDLFLART